MKIDVVAHGSVHGHIDFGPVRFSVVVDVPAMMPELALSGFSRTVGESGAATNVAERSGTAGRSDGGLGADRSPASVQSIGPTFVVRAGTWGATGPGADAGPASSSAAGNGGGDVDGGLELAVGAETAVHVEIVEVGCSGGDVPPGASTAPMVRHGAPVPGGGWFGSVSSAAHGVLSAMTERVVRVEPDWVHLHATAVSVHGSGVVIPAVSGSGKTTLAIELGSLGGVLTDELVALDRSAGLVRAPQRPLSVKASGFARLVANHPDLLAPARDASVMHVPLEAIGLSHVDAVTPHVVVLPNRRPGGCAITPADPGEVLMALIENSYDLDVDPARAFADLVWLAGTCHGLRVVYGDAADVAPVLAGWTADHPDTPAHGVVRTDRVEDGVLAAAMGIGEVRWQPSTRDVAWVKV